MFQEPRRVENHAEYQINGRVRMNKETVERLSVGYMACLTAGQRIKLHQILEKGTELTPEDEGSVPGLGALARTDRLGKSVLGAPLRAALLRTLETSETQPDLIAEIERYCEEGHYGDALDVLDKIGGAFVSMVHSVEEARHISLLFPESERSKSLVLQILEAVNALKSGNTAHADEVFERLRKNFVIYPLDQDQSRTESVIVCFLFTKAVFDDEPLSEAAISNLFDTILRLPDDDLLLLGLMYNLGVDFFLRNNQIEQAEEAGFRSLHYYNKAGLHGLSFYVWIYQSVIGLRRGKLSRVKKNLEFAERDLEAFQGKDEGQIQILNTLKLIHQYECGHPDPLLGFLMVTQEAMSFSELWPAVVEPMISYGCAALTSHVSPAAALSWVRRWRVQQWSAQRFANIISVQEALILQQMHRWQEADELLEACVGTQSAAYHLAQFTSAMENHPRGEELGRQLAQFCEREDLSLRQLAQARILASESAVARQMDEKAVTYLGEAFLIAGPDHLPSFIKEESRRIARITTRPSIRKLLRRRPGLARILRDISNRQTTATGLPEGITRQEFRIMALVAEGLPNKLVAQRLGLALPTVKFHLTNLFRKTGVTGRRALIEVAVRKTWLPGSQ